MHPRRGRIPMDWTNIVIALISFAGTFLGCFSGIKLMSYRIEQLEKKVENYNTILERMAVAERDIKAAHRRLDEVERKVERA